MLSGFTKSNPIHSSRMKAELKIKIAVDDRIVKPAKCVKVKYSFLTESISFLSQSFDILGIRVVAIGETDKTTADPNMAHMLYTAKSASGKLAETKTLSIFPRPTVKKATAVIFIP